MQSKTKYPVLNRHSAAKPLGKVTSIRSGKGRMEVTGVLTPEGERFARRMATQNYGHKPSAIYTAMNQPPLWKREKERNEALALWGTVLLVVATLAFISFLAGDHYTTQHLKSILGN